MECVKRPSEEAPKILEPVLVRVDKKDRIRIDKDEVRNVCAVVGMFKLIC